MIYRFVLIDAIDAVQYLRRYYSSINKTVKIVACARASQNGKGTREDWRCSLHRWGFGTWVDVFILIPHINLHRGTGIGLR